MPISDLFNQLGTALVGQEEQVRREPRFNEQQQQFMDQLLPQLQQMITGQQQRQQQGFEPIAQQRQRQFREETLPTIQEKFTAMGGAGQRSGGQQLAGQRAGEQLQSDLSALQSQFDLQQQGQQNQLLGTLLSGALQAPHENVVQGRQPGLVESGLRGAISALPQALALYSGLGTLGEGAGAAAGAAANAAQGDNISAAPHTSTPLYGGQTIPQSAAQQQGGQLGQQGLAQLARILGVQADPGLAQGTQRLGAAPGAAGLRTGEAQQRATAPNMPAGQAFQQGLQGPEGRQLRSLLANVGQ